MSVTESTAPGAASPEPGDSASRPGAEAYKTVVLSDTARMDVANQPLAAQYEILETIGEGGMGIVYLARDRRLGRYVPIKRLKRGGTGNASLVSRFLREARAIAALRHIHIVHVYALGQDEDGPYIVEEYVAGPQEASPGKNPAAPFSLADRVNRQGPLPVNDAIDVILKLCKAMEFAHACGIIHRDLKPANVLLDQSMEPKIVDFGLARVNDASDALLTAPGDKMLSLGYGAPEQEIDASLTDERADVYGLAAIFYFSLTGKNPRYFREADLPDMLRMPIVKALETAPEKRWSSVRDFSAALNLIKEPSKIELPTIKSTWRCRWCDTVNPVAIQFCGKCGWDGGEFCDECGAETRVGIQFCGNCGADAREYERATQLLQRLMTFRERRQYELLPPHAERISTFQPAGLAGQRLVERVRQLSQEAQEILARRERLRLGIQTEMEARNYEVVRHLIEEYDTITTGHAFASVLESLPSLTVKRELELSREALERGNFETALRLTEHILTSLDRANADAGRLHQQASLRRRQRRVRRIGQGSAAAFVLYVLSAAPVHRLLEDSSDDLCSLLYASVYYLHDETALREPLERYARAWDVPSMFGVPAAAASVAATPGSASTAPPGPPADDVLKQMTHLRDEHEGKLAAIDLETKRKLTAWPHEYAASLSDLQQKMQQAGDFDSWYAVTNEIVRFQGDPHITDENLVVTPEALRSIQQKFQRLTLQYNEEKGKKVVAADRDYLGRLLGLQKDLTVHGRMNDAMTVNAEIKRIRTILEGPEPEPDKRKPDPPPAKTGSAASTMIPWATGTSASTRP